MTYSTEWLYQTFFPQEDPSQLLLLRASLSPFQKAVMKALCFELESYSLASAHQIKQLARSIIDEILGNIPTEGSASNFVSNQASDTLQAELDELIQFKIVP